MSAESIHLAVRGLIVVAAIIGAAFLAFNRREGWGWLVFLAFIVAASI